MKALSNVFKNAWSFPEVQVWIHWLDHAKNSILQRLSRLFIYETEIPVEDILDFKLESWF